MVFTYEFDNTILIKATGSGEAIIPEKCTANCGHVRLTSVIFNEKLIEIDSSAFRGCTGLTR